MLKNILYILKAITAFSLIVELYPYISKERTNSLPNKMKNKISSNISTVDIEELSSGSQDELASP